MSKEQEKDCNCDCGCNEHEPCDCKENETCDCEHDCNCDEDADDIRVTLTLDDDTEVECLILTIFPVNNQDYIALLPTEDEDDESNEDGEVFLYRYSEGEDGEPILDNIEDDDEYELVADAFDEMLDEADFEDMD